jgi:hypothetical protein
VAKQPKGELAPVVVGFNYALLETKVAEEVRSSADRIRERVKKTVEDIIMSVAERFKSAKIADLPIQPSAAYFLAAPSVPDEARQVAVEKAEAGEETTFATAREIVAVAKMKRRPRRQKVVPADKLGVRLIKMLRRYQERWPGERPGAAEGTSPTRRPRRRASWPGGRSVPWPSHPQRRATG